MNYVHEEFNEQQYNLYKSTEFMTAQKVTTESVKSKEVLQILKDLESGKKTIEEIRQYYTDMLSAIKIRREERRGWVDGQKAFTADLKKDAIKDELTIEIENPDVLIPFKRGYYDAYKDYERRKINGVVSK